MSWDYQRGDGLANVAIHNVRKSFGQLSVLKDISLNIRHGEFVSLVGPSGCGKSTLLRIIAGLEPQTSGDIFIDDRNVNDVRPSARDLSMVFQSYALYPHLTVKENLVVPLKLRDLTWWQRIFLIGRFLPGAKNKLTTINKIANDTAELLQITALLDRKPGQLSGGQRQRVAVGRAMVRDPTAFLMDEPLSNLDASLRVHMRAEIAELHRQLGATFVYVTHDQAEALTMSNRIAVMMGGRILQFDTPAKIYNDPQDIRVAEFIGSPKMNMLQGQLDANGSLTLSDGTVIPGKSSETARAVNVGIRPEHMTIGTDATPSVSMTVRHIENLGSDLFVHSQADDSKKTIIVRGTLDLVGCIDHGTKTNAWIDPSKVYLFGEDNLRVPFVGGV
jgi:multiple sugar transport system ATP-binding protein